MADSPSIVLKSSGLEARIAEDRYLPGTFSLVVGGTPQSHVDVGDPSHLFYEYVRRIGHLVDLVADPGKPITAVHLGAGALTLPRYVEATRPGSRQQVVELERDLVDFVREHLPLPSKASMRIRYGDAREVLAGLPSGLRGSVDLLVVDVFSGARIPAHVTSLEFYELAASFLSPGGIIAVNIADGAGLEFARGQVATLGMAVGEVAVLAEAGVLGRRRFGNLVLAGARELPLEWMPRLLAGGPHPAKVLAGRELRDFTAGARIVTDATAVQSPEPNRSVFGG